MYVEDSSEVAFKKWTRQQTHIAGETDEFNIAIAQRSNNLRVMFLARSASSCDQKRFDSPRGGCCNAGSIRLITDYYSKFCARDETRFDGTGKGQHVRAATGD